MRLINPSPGELLDRQTILELKIKHSDRQEFVDEYNAIGDYKNKNNIVVDVELYDELLKINSRLWDLEDRQRYLIKTVNWTNHPDIETGIYEFVDNAKIVIELNDARANTVRKINEACGIQSAEKLFK